MEDEVQLAGPRPEGSEGMIAASSSGSINVSRPCATVVLTGLHDAVTEADLISLVDSLGLNILRLDYPWHRFGPLRGRPKGFALIQLASHAQAATFLAALEIKTVKLRGKKLNGQYNNSGDLLETSVIALRKASESIRGDSCLVKRPGLNADKSSAFIRPRADVPGTINRNIRKISAELDHQQHKRARVSNDISSKDDNMTKIAAALKHLQR